jgi:hypothetical protein
MNMTNVPKNMYKAGFLLALFILSSFSVLSFPRNTDAILGMADTVIEIGPNLFQNTLNTVQAIAGHLKGYVLDPLAWALSKAVLQSVVHSTVNWVNNGFNGSPAFVTNLGTTLLQVSNTQADSFLRQLTTNGSIHSPFQGVVASIVGASYNRSTNGGFFASNPYTLNKVTKNDSAFLRGNFIQGGGLNTLFAEVMNPANNPAGATMIASAGLTGQVSNAVTTRNKELDWSKGINAFRGKCGAPGKTILNLIDPCLGASIKTPGAVIMSGLEKSLGSGIDTLVNAHTFDEIIGSVLSQLINQVVGNGGLSGASDKPSSTGASSGYFQKSDPSLAASTLSLSTEFTHSIASEITTLNTFQNEWQTLLAAASSAKAAVQSSASCGPSAQTILGTIVQPAIDQGTTEIAKTTTAITAVSKIQTEVSGPSPTTAQVAQASKEYTDLFNSGTLPSPSETAFADSQSQQTTSTTSPTLLSQLTRITQDAQSGKCGSTGT